MFLQDILIQILLVLGVLVVAYLFLIRPQLRRITEHNRLLSSLELGDQVVTGGGLIGTIVKLEGADIVEIMLSDAMRVRALRSSIEEKLGERRASNVDFADLADGHNTSISRSLTTLLLVLSMAGSVGATDLQGADEDVLEGLSPLIGSRSEFRHRLFSIDNPYCAIVTYVAPDLSEQATSTKDADDRSVIVIDAPTLKTDRAYGHFLMAHECCHHTLGHTRLTSPQFGQLGPQPFYYLQPLLKNMEFDADGCAVRMLKRANEFNAIESARKRMLEFGTTQTGAYYPTGIERADNIDHHLAAED